MAGAFQDYQWGPGPWQDYSGPPVGPWTLAGAFQDHQWGLGPWQGRPGPSVGPWTMAGPPRANQRAPGPGTSRYRVWKPHLAWLSFGLYFRQESFFPFVREVQHFYIRGKCELTSPLTHLISHSVPLPRISVITLRFLLFFRHVFPANKCLIIVQLIPTFHVLQNTMVLLTFFVYRRVPYCNALLNVKSREWM